MPKLGPSRDVYELLVECKYDEYKCAEAIGLPKGWKAKSMPRPSDQDLCDMRFVSTTGETLRSMKQFYEALGLAHYPDWLRARSKPVIPPMTAAEKEFAYGKASAATASAAASPASAPKAGAAKASSAAPASATALSPKGTKRPAADMAAELTAAAKGPPAANAKVEPGASASALATVSADWPPAKLHDEMVGKIARGEQADGYALAQRQDSFLVQPDDVLSIADLDVLAAKIVSSGWHAKDANSCSKTSRVFTGKADVALYANEGRLLVRSSDRSVAALVAELYVDSWLLA